MNVLPFSIFNFVGIYIWKILLPPAALYLLYHSFRFASVSSDHWIPLIYLFKEIKLYGEQGGWWFNCFLMVRSPRIIIFSIRRLMATSLLSGARFDDDKEIEGWFTYVSYSQKDKSSRIMMDHAKTETEAIPRALEYFGCDWIPVKKPV